MKKLILVLLFICSFVSGQELEIVKPHLGQFQEWYFFDAVGENFEFTINATNFQSDDTIFVIKDDYYDNVIDTLLISDFVNDTISWSYVIPQEDFFMISFICLRSPVTYVQALMTKNLLLSSSVEVLENANNYKYYDMNGKLCLPHGLVFRSDRKKFYFE